MPGRYINDCIKSIILTILLELLITAIDHMKAKFLLIVYGLMSLKAASQSPASALFDEFDYLRNASCKMVVNDVYTCSATLIDSWDESGASYLISAAHCAGSNPIEHVRFIFGDQQLLASSDELKGSQWESNGDFELLARSDELDFILFRIEEEIPSWVSAYELGWNSQVVYPAYVISYHYAGYQTQQIAMKRNEVRFGSFPGLGEGYEKPFWRVPGWTVGHTDVGSSGGGLIDQHGRYLGGLSGSTANSRDTIDYFFRFDAAYGGSNMSDGALQPWLDPNGRGKSEGEYVYSVVKANNFHYSDSVVGYERMVDGDEITTKVELEDTTSIHGIYLTVGSFESFSLGSINVSLSQNGHRLALVSGFMVDLTANAANFLELLEPITVTGSVEISLEADFSYDSEYANIPMIRTGNISDDVNMAPMLGFLKSGGTVVEARQVDTITESMICFPNPTNDWTYLAPYMVTDFPQVFDSKGRQVYPNMIILNDELLIDWLGYDNGLYHILNQRNDPFYKFTVLVRR